MKPLHFICAIAISIAAFLLAIFSLDAREKFENTLEDRWVILLKDGTELISRQSISSIKMLKTDGTGDEIQSGIQIYFDEKVERMVLEYYDEGKSIYKIALPDYITFEKKEEGGPSQ